MIASQPAPPDAPHERPSRPSGDSSDFTTQVHVRAEQWSCSVADAGSEVDPFEGEPRNAFPIDVPAGENRVAWVDVLVPQDAVAGTYVGALTVSASGFSVTVPLEMGVLDFVLPSTASLPSAFGMPWDGQCLAHYGQSCFRLPPPLAD